jgi:hypothetical protein
MQYPPQWELVSLPNDLTLNRDSVVKDGEITFSISWTDGWTALRSSPFDLDPRCDYEVVADTFTLLGYAVGAKPYAVNSIWWGGWLMLEDQPVQTALPEQAMLLGHEDVTWRLPRAQGQARIEVGFYSLWQAWRDDNYVKIRSIEVRTTD